jgi:hypothetical protein
MERDIKLMKHEKDCLIKENCEFLKKQFEIKTFNINEFEKENRKLKFSNNELRTDVS